MVTSSTQTATYTKASSPSVNHTVKEYTSGQMVTSMLASGTRGLKHGYGKWTKMVSKHGEKVSMNKTMDIGKEEVAKPKEYTGNWAKGKVSGYGVMLYTDIQDTKCNFCLKKGQKVLLGGIY
jgi:hypothetical protein